MSARTLAAFSTIRTEGAMLPSDILVRVASGDKSLGGLEESSYHLAPGEKIGEATNRAWNRLQAAWANFQSAREKLAATDTGTSLTRERWLLPLFQLLDYGRLQAAKAEEIGGKSYAISHAWQQTPIHLVGCNVDLDRRTQTAAGGMRSSPHSVLQELLNRNDQHLWGIVSNGLRLRLLRDNISLTRQAYVEFDLEAMMAGEAYPDFVLLWLLLHQSRFEAERPDQCQLEKWSQAARTEGVRVLDGLRDGVQRSIEHLGQGFLAHPSNAALRENLRSGELDKQDYYRQILRLVYRLLFLFVADDRDLLLPPTADPVAQKRYRNFYATTRLRHLATTRAGSRHHDLYCGLKLVMEKLSGDGCTELALPALGSFLFSPRALPDLNACDISNLHFLEAIRSLAVTQTGQSRRVVDYKNLGAEELGSVYESLLELHPDLNPEAATFELKVAAGSERKKTGSYYTPTSLISCLLDSALDPVLLEAAKQPEPEVAILKLKVVDPACGSGHFLIAAAHRIAKRLAAARTGEEEPPPEAQRKAIRDVIGHCIYGVDVNPMAVELCKVSLWMEALEPGKPLSFLEHRIQCGNSLLGATPALLAQGIPDEAFTPIEGDDKEICKEFNRINKDERNKQMRLFAATTEPWLQLGNFAASLMNLDTVGDDSIEVVREKERVYEEAIRSGDYLDGRFWADTWCAAFVWKKTRAFGYPITEEAFRRIERNPHACEPWMRREIERLAGEYRFLHWHMAFPDVFRVSAADEKPGNVETGWTGGFNVVLGNPPWEMPEVDDRQFFWDRRPDLAQEPSARKRAALIQELASSDARLYAEWTSYCRRHEGERLMFSSAGILPYAGRGRLNYCRLFIEQFWNICSRNIGIVVASGLATKEYDQPLWHRLLGQGAVASLFDFVNTEHLFPAIHDWQKFTLLTLSRSSTDQISTACWLTNPAQIASRTVDLPAADLDAFSPGTRFLPQFTFPHDLTLLRSTHQRFASLASQDEWGYLPRLMFSSSDRGFAPVPDLEARAWEHIPPNHRRSSQGKTYAPVYEGKMVGIYDHRQADIYLNPANPSRQAQERDVPASQKRDPTRFVIPQSWLDYDVVRSRRLQGTGERWSFAFCDVTSALNERTCIAAVIPVSGLTRSMPAIYIEPPVIDKVIKLVSALSSLPVDYLARLKVATNHLTQGIMDSMPLPPPRAWDADFGARLDLAAIRARVLELVYTAWDMTGFARDCGYEGPPFKWDDERRFLLRAELDAFYFHLYKFERDDAVYILGTFPKIRNKDEQRFGEYRTKRVILEIYDAMAQAERTGVLYQTRLDPPPADPRVAHPPVQVIGAVKRAQPASDVLAAVAAGAWATPVGLEPENLAFFALIDVLRAFGGSAKPSDVQLAAVLVRNPAMLLAFLDADQARAWVRALGPAAQPLPANVIQISQFQRNVSDLPWARAVATLEGSGALRTGADAWTATANFPASSGQAWMAGRAAVAVDVVSGVVAPEVQERIEEYLRSVEDGSAIRAVS
jgi:hypothetical protein